MNRCVALRPIWPRRASTLEITHGSHHRTHVLLPGLLASRVAVQTAMRGMLRVLRGRHTAAGLSLGPSPLRGLGLSSCRTPGGLGSMSECNLLEIRLDTKSHACNPVLS